MKNRSTGLSQWLWCRRWELFSEKRRVKKRLDGWPEAFGFFPFSCLSRMLRSCSCISSSIGCSRFFSNLLLLPSFFRQGKYIHLPHDDSSTFDYIDSLGIFQRPNITKRLWPWKQSIVSPSTESKFQINLKSFDMFMIVKILWLRRGLSNLIYDMEIVDQGIV